MKVENLMQLSQNKEIPFVDRVINPQNYPPSIFDDSSGCNSFRLLHRQR